MAKIFTVDISTSFFPLSICRPIKQIAFNLFLLKVKR